MNADAPFPPPLDPFPPQTALVRPYSPAAAIARWQRRMLRRLVALLCTGSVAFTLTTWFLVRRQPAAAPPPSASEPARTVRAQLDALNRGDVRAAYDLFSPRYRANVPFTAFRELVNSHREMFRTREQDVESHEESNERVQLDMHLLADDGEYYVAYYTVVRLEGRWWIDDLHWGTDDGDDNGDVTSA